MDVLGGRKVEQKGADNMSFVGLHNTNEGIIAFADSKGTIEEGGYPRHDKRRGEIPKIFKTNKFICVTYGNNQIPTNTNYKNLEDVIRMLLKDNDTYIDFFYKLDRYVQRNCRGLLDYRFLIGTKNESGAYVLTDCCIEKGKAVAFGYEDVEKQSKTAGNRYYVEAYDAQASYSDVPIREYVEIIKKHVEKLIETKDLFSQYEYNYAGKPVITDIFQ